jgi:hypothetical protein
VKEIHGKLDPLPFSSTYSKKYPRPECLQGTREAVLGDLSRWVNDYAPQLTTLWLNGMAGTGKSAIANTFAKKIEDDGLVGAIFSVDRQLAERRDPHRIAQSLAYQLAMQNPHRLQSLWSSLCAEPNIRNVIDDSSLKKQVRVLIKRPLDLDCTETLIILIDGLDECTPSDGARLLSTLVDCLSHLPIKLFVASRRDTDIIESFESIPHAEIRLQEQPVEEISQDVQLYWEDSLDQLCRVKRLPDWRSIVNVDVLVELTGPLFIYATTMLMIVRNTMGSPIEKLRGLLDISRSGSAIAFVGLEKRYPLENLYMHILAEAIKDYDGDTSPEHAARLHDILEVVIFARKPLTALALSELLDMDGITLKNLLATLSSVLVIPAVTSDQDAIRPFHQSFIDFILRHGNDVHHKLAMDSAVADGHVAGYCFGLLNKTLRYNICGIDDPSLFNDEISDFNILVSHHISLALRYASLFWAVHWASHMSKSRSASVSNVSQTEAMTTLLPSGLRDFCDSHLLHWIEVLSLLEYLDAAALVMNKLLATIKVRIVILMAYSTVDSHACFHTGTSVPKGRQHYYSAHRRTFPDKGLHESHPC